MRLFRWAIGFTVLAFIHTAYSQKMTVKDTDANVLMEVNDEGSSGSITLPAGAAPVATDSRLYNIGGTLYWNGSALSSTGSGGTGVWTDGDGAVVLTTSSDSVGIGTSGPSAKLTILQSGNAWGDGLRLSYSGTDWDMKVDAGALHFGRAGQGVVEFNGSGGVLIHAPTAASAVIRFDENGTGTMEAGYDQAGDHFYIGDAGAAAGALVVKQTTGRTGIGTVDPQNVLDVEGSAAIGAGYSGTFTAPANGMIVEGNLGLGTNAPVSRLDVAGAAGYSQLRLRTSYTPVNYADSNGNVGDIAWDDSYLYLKTSVGWKRAKWNNM